MWNGEVVDEGGDSFYTHDIAYGFAGFKLYAYFNKMTRVRVKATTRKLDIFLAYY